MKIFVTGGTGFIGSHFIKLALNDGHEIVALKRESSRCSITLKQEPEWVLGDLESFAVSALAGCDALVHLAAHGATDPTGASWEECFRWNVVASLGLWRSAINSGVGRLVIAGSCFEYGVSAESYDFIPTSAPLLPTGPYHSSKAAASMAAIGLGIQTATEIVILRPFHAFGDGEAPHRFWPALREAALAGKDFVMTSGTQVRDFVPVEMVARNFLSAVTRTGIPKGKPTIENLGTGKARTLLEFATDEWERLGAKGSLIPGVRTQRMNEVMRYVPDIGKVSGS